MPPDVHAGSAFRLCGNINLELAGIGIVTEVALSSATAPQGQLKQMQNGPHPIVERESVM
jgi:hypothetical protein